MRPGATFEGSSMREEINSAIKSAMKSGDKLRLSTLRMVSSAIKNRDIEARTTGQEVTNDELMQLLAKLIKQREESAAMYDKGGRAELATQERDEAAIIASFLPQQVAEEEMRAAIADAIADIGATSIKDMGKGMAALTAGYTGRMDFAKAGAVVKSLLG
jgi:uncharacterized protein YqeY